MAATGFQKGSREILELEKEFKDLLDSEDKTKVFIQHTLRSGKDIINQGGHVTNKLSERNFRLLFDNKRLIVDSNKSLKDSKPLETAELGDYLRSIGNLPKRGEYSTDYGTDYKTVYKGKRDVVIRNFLKALLNNELNIDVGVFEGYSELVKYINNYSSEYKISENGLAQLKRRSKFVKVDRNLESEKFVAYVKERFPQFDDTLILN